MWVKVYEAEDDEHKRMAAALPDVVRAMVVDRFAVVAGGWVLRNLIGAGRDGVDVDLVTVGAEPKPGTVVAPTSEDIARRMGKKYLPSASGFGSAGGGACERFAHRWLAGPSVDVIVSPWHRNTIASWDATVSMVFLDDTGVWADREGIADMCDGRVVLRNPPNDTPRLHRRLVKLAELMEFRTVAPAVLAARQ
jgi:hypothetical protein